MNKRYIRLLNISKVYAFLLHMSMVYAYIYLLIVYVKFTHNCLLMLV